MRFPTRPLRRTRMMGMPPQTLPSNPRRTFWSSAAFIKLKPSTASRALLAVTTCFPPASARCMKLRAGSIPPTNSTTKSQPLLMTFSGSSVRRSRSTPGRCLLESRTSIFVMFKSTPARWRISALFLLTSSTRPPPTVPQPSSPIFSLRIVMCFLLAGSAARN